MKPRRRDALLALAAALLALAPATPAHSHEMPAERALIAQMTPGHVELLLTHEEPASERVSLLLARYDLDRDGQLRGPEARLAARQWLPHTLAGLRFEVPGQAPRSLPPEIKFERTPEGALRMAALMRYELPELEPGAQRTLRIRLDEDWRVTETATIVQARRGVRLDKIAGAPAPGERAGPFTLRAGADLAVVFERRPKHRKNPVKP